MSMQARAYWLRGPVMTVQRIYPLKRAVSRPNAKKAMQRLFDDLQRLIDRAPKTASPNERLAAKCRVTLARLALEQLYREPK